MSRIASWIVLVLSLVAVGAGTWYFFLRGGPEDLALPPPAPQVQAPPPVAATEPKPIEHPIEEAPAAKPLPALGESDGLYTDALGKLVGASAVREHFFVQGGVRRIVATVDNLTREKLPGQLLPVKPVGGEFRTTRGEQGPVIAADNAQRYSTYVKLIESIDARQAAQLYVQMYPLFQQAYRELGYPQGYFNDRLVQVIDHLLLAPEPTGPIVLAQPKVRYDFADPALAQLSAGQKAMVRVGLDNERRIKAKLRELRAEVTRKR